MPGSLADAAGPAGSGENSQHHRSSTSAIAAAMAQGASEDAMDFPMRAKRPYFVAMGDSRLTVQQPNVRPKNRVLFSPISTLRGCWDALVLLGVVATMIVVPLRVGFKIHAIWLEALLDAVFVLDVLVNFETGISYRGVIIMDRRRVRLRYLSTWFALDVLAAVPPSAYAALMEVLIDIGEASILMPMMPMIKFLRLPRLFRYLMRWRDVLPFSSAVLRALFLFFFAIIFSHWDACVMFHIAEVMGGTWVEASGLADEPIFVQGSETGYFHATTTPEIWATMFSIAVGLGFYTFLIGNISSIIQNTDRIWADYHSKMDKWAKFCRIHDVSTRLQKRGFQTLAVKPTRRYVDDAQMLQAFKPAFRAQVAICMKATVIKRSYLFKGCNQEVIDALARAMVQQTYMEGDMIARVGDPVQELYFVTHGEVKASDEDEDEEHLGPGECFGEECILIEMKRMHDDEDTCVRFRVLEVDSRQQAVSDPAELSRSGLATTEYSEVLGGANSAQPSMTRAASAMPPGLSSPLLARGATDDDGEDLAPPPPIWAYSVVANESDTICYVLYCSDFIEIAERSTAKRFPNCIPELPPDIEATPAQELQRAQSW
eukprot:jgi/Tetstr1/423575/TSEL_014247.t1